MSRILHKVEASSPDRDRTQKLWISGHLDELSRAEARADAEVPSDVIGLGSAFACRETDGVRAHYRWAQLVTPKEADPALTRISIVSDLGAALIGLATGQSITWPDRRGSVREITVLEVEKAE